MSKPLRPILAAILIAVAAGCAPRVNIKATTTGAGALRSIKASAIVEFTKNKTEKGRAIIMAKAPDSFTIEIKGPLGATIALIRGGENGLTFISRGKEETFEATDPRLPLNMSANEVVSLLLGRLNPAGKDASFITKDLPQGRSVRRLKDNGEELYRAVLSDYRIKDGFSLPYTIAIEGNGYKLIIKYLNVKINSGVKDRGHKDED